jgi:transketolase
MSIEFFTERNAKLLSRMGIRAAFGQAVNHLAKIYDFQVMSADLGRSSGLGPFINEFPERYIGAGIAEQNMIGVAAGMTKIGLKPILTTFAPFFSFRSSEQIRMNLGYMQQPVILVALASGVALGTLGNSHFGLEDIAIMRNIPNLQISCPSDAFELYKVLEYAIIDDKPHYIRLNGSTNCPIVNKSNYDFVFGKHLIQADFGDDILIISNGSQVYPSIENALYFKELGVGIKVINIHTINPFDFESFDSYIKESCVKTIIIAEEHSVNGSLGSIVTEYLFKNNLNLDLHVIGFPLSEFVVNGSYQYILESYNLTFEGIKKTINNIIKN